MDTTSRAVHPIVAGPHPVIPRTVVSPFTQMPIYLGVATSPESSDERVANFAKKAMRKRILLCLWKRYKISTDIDMLTEMRYTP